MANENQTLDPVSPAQGSVPAAPAASTVDPIANAPSSATQGNTSGQGSSAAVPEEVKGWSWGAFFLSWI